MPYTIDNYYNEDDKLLSYFGRANYDYQSKYLLSATFRADASSKFSKENRWGYFPSAAVAWRISSGPFMERSKSWLEDLKTACQLRGPPEITTSLLVSWCKCLNRKR